MLKYACATCRRGISCHPGHFFNISKASSKLPAEGAPEHAQSKCCSTNGVDRTEATDANAGSHDCCDGASCRCDLCQHLYTVGHTQHMLSISNLQQISVSDDATRQSDPPEHPRQWSHAHVRKLNMDCSWVEWGAPTKDLRHDARASTSSPSAYETFTIVDDTFISHKTLRKRDLLTRSSWPDTATTVLNLLASCFPASRAASELTVLSTPLVEPEAPDKAIISEALPLTSVGFNCRSLRIACEADNTQLSAYKKFRGHTPSNGRPHNISS